MGAHEAGSSDSHVDGGADAQAQPAGQPAWQSDLWRSQQHDKLQIEIDTAVDVDAAGTPTISGQPPKEATAESLAETQTLHDLFDWPRRMIATMQDSGTLKQLLSHLNGDGLNIVTYYSGQDCAMQAVDMVCSTLEAMGCSGIKVTNVHACDNDELCQRVLRSWQGPRPAAHIFGDILEHVPADLRTELDRIDAETQVDMTKNTPEGSAMFAMPTSEKKRMVTEIGERKFNQNAQCNHLVALQRRPACNVLSPWHELPDT